MDDQNQAFIINNPNNIGNILLFILFALFLTVLIRTAWVGDDAFITLRSVLNFVNGNGLVFNVGERVQVYTHTLWFFILSLGYFLMGSVFYSTFFISILVSTIAVYILIKKLACDYKTAILAFILLLHSQAFIDYCTSGLENPLSFLLLASFIILFLNVHEQQYKNGIFKLIFVFSLIYLNRPDTILLVLPLLLYATYQYYKLQKLSLLNITYLYILGNILVIAWVLFSLFYYGYPFPNTAYAKLGTGIPSKHLILQGVYYYLDSIKYDPITLNVIFIMVVFSFFIRKTFLVLLSIGIILYGLYILKIGGDFMSGRFFSLPFFAALIILSRFTFENLRLYLIIVVVVLAFSSYSITSNNNNVLRSMVLPSHIVFETNTGIFDERQFYVHKHYRGLLFSDRHFFLNYPDYSIKNLERYEAIRAQCGFLGYQSLQAGPKTYFIDTCALAEPLLSRLNMDYKPDWRIGHFYRKIPEGYRESIEKDENLIKDESLHKFYEKVRLITRGELFSLERLQAIFFMNIGKYQHYLDNYEQKVVK